MYNINMSITRSSVGYHVFALLIDSRYHKKSARRFQVYISINVVDTFYETRRV